MKKGERAITIIDTDGIYKHIAYLCDNNHCLNEWELKQGAYQDEILENSIK